MLPRRMDTTTIIAILIIGFAAGILSGMVGVGGGIIIVPALVFFLGFTQHQAQGTSLGLLLLPVGILAVMNYYKAGNIDLKIVGLMAVTFVAGGYLGSKWSLMLPQETVKKIFAIFLFYTAFKMMGWEKALISWVKGLTG
ncbi:MAG: sulfite exporter TauE/SafE family protein [Lacibacter sp.]